MAQHVESTESNAPTDLGEVTTTIQSTLLSVWNDFVEHLPFLVVGVAVLVLTWITARLLQRLAPKLIGHWKMRQSMQDLIVRLWTIAIWAVGLLLAAMVVFPGLTPAKALGALGLVSIAVGFAFKDIFENFFAGILILWRFPFENGDFIECEGIMGKVENVTIRMTEIRRPTGELVVVPNAFLFKSPVKVMTSRPKRRVSIMTGVAYDEDVEQSVDVIQKAVESCKTVDGDEPIQVFPHGFGASSIDIDVAWWTDPSPLGERRSRGEVVAAVKRALDDAGIEIPFPYRTLTFKEPLALRGRRDDGAGADTGDGDRAAGNRKHPNGQAS